VTLYIFPLRRMIKLVYAILTASIWMYRICHAGRHLLVFIIIITLLTYEAEHFLSSRQLCSPPRTSQHFMEPEGSIPCSQEPFIGLYPEPYQYNPLLPILPLYDPSQYCPPTYVLVFPLDSFILAFPPISYMRSSFPHSCYVPRPSHPS
jgi:hypothetical protein